MKLIRVLMMTVLGALGAPLSAAPMTLQELDFLLRQGTSEDEIVNDVAQRKLIVPIDENAGKLLKQNGATDALLARLRGPGMFLTQEEARAAFERVVAQKARAEAAARADTASAASAPKPGPTGKAL